MLFASLVISLLILIGANRLVSGRRATVSQSGAIVLLSVGLLGGLSLGSLLALLQSMFTLIAAFVLLTPGRGRKLYFPATIVATLAAWGIVLRNAGEEQVQYAALRERYPYESLEGRLPARPQHVLEAPFESRHLDRFEEGVERGAWNMRGWALKELHEQQLNTFVNSPGFGSIRMMRPGKWAVEVPDDAPIPQPGEESRKHPSAGVVGTWSGEEDTLALGGMHALSLLDFANPKRFGLVKDRTHVAGFLSHGMTQVPDPTERWAVRTLDLIGLLLSSEPRAYVSAYLPRMDELRKSPTRPLDVFESAGMAELRAGKELFVKGSDAEARMLGAVRAAKQCLVCHGGNRGDLLGAFSYRLRPRR